MPQNKLIIFITLLFILCSGYLFFVSDQGLKSDAGKSWWALYFEEPQGADLKFIIENHSPQTAFHWTVFGAGQKISEGDVRLKTGESKIIQPETEDKKEKISITVSSGTDKKEIYKNL